MLDLALSTGEAQGGVVMDITKAFDALPRQPILEACLRLGLPPGLLRAWTGAMTANRRHFILDGHVGEGLLTQRGVPQGCGLSCLAMTVLNLALLYKLAWTLPAVVPHIYADNWELTAPDALDLQAGYHLVQQVAGILDLRMDQRKTHWWATSSAYRTALRSQGVRLIASARDLGAHLAYTRKATKQGIRDRQLLPTTWATLRASLAQPVRKAQALTRTLWPRALHSADTNPPNEAVRPWALA